MEKLEFLFHLSHSEDQVAQRRCPVIVAKFEKCFFVDSWCHFTGCVTCADFFQAENAVKEFFNLCVAGPRKVGDANAFSDDAVILVLKVGDDAGELAGNSLARSGINPNPPHRHFHNWRAKVAGDVVGV